MGDYTDEERRAHDEGREAYKANVDYFSSPYMQPPRNLYLLCAWSQGWMAEAGEASCAKCEGQHDPAMPCAALSAEAEDRRALNI